MMPERTLTLRKPIASLKKRLILGVASLIAATAIWLPCLHFVYWPTLPPPKNESEVEPLASRLAAQQLYLWTDAESRQRELAKMRGSNAEWDFMGRSFLVWALANRSLRHPEKKDACLEVMDRIIDETLKTEQERGMYHFLMPYARNRPFVIQPPRSLFLDGEMALMLAARRLVAEKEAYREPLRQRVEEMVRRMEAGPVLCAESYPDECWMFCNSVALAAVRMSDRLDRSDHSDFFRRWLQKAKEKLVDPGTGLLVSSFTLDGRPKDGPEGSSIWLTAHCLQLIDEEFAADQYRRARKELGRELLGFGYAREWPVSWVGAEDVDSGPVVPVLGVSAGSSGLAFLGARAFDDRAYFRELQASIDFAAFPSEREARLRYCASNQVGDAVLFYAAVLGPLWNEVRNKPSEALRP
ncbi:MAG: hypothetical protein ABSG53_10730 [Thermoguttaceae bacterium]|jgi:hypothetical protein